MDFAHVHVHKIYNYDGTGSIPALLARAQQIGLDVIATTRHDQIAGSLRAMELAT